jgi:hypothetical protein
LDEWKPSNEITELPKELNDGIKRNEWQKQNNFRIGLYSFSTVKNLTGEKKKSHR